MSHTPGPWRASPLNVVMTESDKDGDWKGIADCRTVDTTKEEQAGNACLIAAAPDLLAACKSMLKTCGSSADWNGETHESLLLIEAAIAKAEGSQP